MDAQFTSHLSGTVLKMQGICATAVSVLFLFIKLFPSGIFPHQN
jgi:hypothetical protein